MRTSDAVSIEGSRVTEWKFTEVSRVSISSYPERNPSKTIACVHREMPELDEVEARRQNEEARYEERQRPTQRA